MSSFVAVVKSIVGQVFVVSPEGFKRLLVEGDHLFTGDQVDTGTAGAVSLELADGRTLDLGRDTQWSADTPDSSTDLAEATAQAAPSVKELQQAIAAGTDPTNDLEATAAGPSAAGPGGAAGGGHSFVMLDATAGRVDPTIGFPTAGIGSGALTTQNTIGGETGDHGANTLRASTLSLTATPTITEAGGVLVYTATLTQAPLTDLIITLSNGAVIVIPGGQLTGSVSVPLPPNDTVYKDPAQIDVTVTGITGGGGIAVTPPTGPATTHVTDTIDTTTVTLTAVPSIIEGNQITYTATLTHPAQTPVTVTLSNGAVITIDAGKTTGSVNVPTPANDVYNNGSTVSASIESATGGNFENLVPNPAPAATTITDSIDTTGLTLTASDTITEGGQITYTATLTHPAQTPVTVTLSNGAVITIDAGKTTGSVDVPTPANDVYNNGSTVSASIASATGGNFENLVPNQTPAVTTITDSIDNTALTLTANDTITEGDQITYTATLTNLAQTPVTVTLSNGAVITIDAGKTTGSVDVPTPANDVYNNGSTVSASIESATGGNFEQLTPSTTPAVTTITDSIDDTGLTLTANDTITEGGQITYTATLTNLAQTAVTVTLSNGAVITIDAGKTTGSVDVPTLANDVYNNGSTVSASIESATGGNFEQLTPSATPAVTTITDSIDDTGLSLTATTSVAEGGQIIYTATLTNPAGTAMTVTLSNGAVIDIEAGKTSGSVAVNAPTDDVYLDASTVQATITNSTGGNFENLVTDTTPVSTSVTDTIDPTGLSLTASGSVAEGSQITYTATLSNPAGTAMSVTLSNGAVINIDAGKSTGSVAFAAPGDDYYIDAGSVSAKISTSTGGNFENLVIDSTPVVTSVTDTISQSSVKLTATDNVNENGTITYTVSISSTVTGSPVIVTLANGQTITIPVGQSTGIATITAPNDVLTGHAPLTNSITDVSGGNYEKLVADKTPVRTDVTDTVDATHLSLTATGSVAEGGQIIYTATLSSDVPGWKTDTAMSVTLSNGAVIHIDAGASTGSVTVNAPTDDVYLDAGNVLASIKTTTGSNFENLVIDKTPVSTSVTDTIDTTHVSLTATASVAEAGQITYTATLSNPAGTAVTVTLSNGAVINIDPGKTSGSVVIDTPKDDVYLDATQVQQTITKAVGGNFENLVIDSTPAVTSITDTLDTSTVKLFATTNINEGGTVTYTASVTSPVTGSPVIVTLANLKTITIAVGESTGSITIAATNDAVIGHAPLTNSITSVSGGNYENLVPDSTPVSTLVLDTIDMTQLTLSATPSVSEGGQIIYTANLTNPAGTAMTVTLSNGAVITIDAGDRSGSVAIDAPKDDVYLDAGKVQAAITTATGGNFENLVTDDTPASTLVTDTLNATQLSLSASDTVAEGGHITYTATLSSAAGTPVGITLSNGAVIYIDAGKTTGSVVVDAPKDDPYLDAGKVQATITAATGGNFENLVTLDTPAITSVTDTIDTSTVKLSATQNADGSVTYSASVSAPVTGTAVIVTLANGQPITIPVGESSAGTTLSAIEDALNGHTNAITSVSGGNYEKLVADNTSVSASDATHLTLSATDSVAEGGQITYTATLTNATGSAMTVTLSNGAVITIDAGKTTGSVVVDAPKDDVYLDAGKVQAAISTTTGGDFTNLSTDNTPAATNVTDTLDTTNLSLTATDSVAEGGPITYTAALTHPAGTAMNVTLSNGAVIHIDAGQTTGTVVVNAPNNDVYLDASQVQATITAATGGNFENLVTSSAPAVTAIADSPDTSTVKLTATDNVNEDGTVTYTASVTSPVTDSAVIVTLANGQTITIPVGQSTGSVTTMASNDLLLGHPALTNSITQVSGGNYENLVADTTPVSTTVIDSVDTTHLSLTATASVEEGGQIIYTATLSNPADTAVTVTLSNGAVINIGAGTTSGSVNVNAPQGDVYLDVTNVSANITAATGGHFENLAVDHAPVITDVTDTVATADATTLSLSASDSAAEGGQITYTATLSNPAGTPMAVTLSNGAVISIDTGKTTGSVIVNAPQDDVYLDAGSVQATITTTTGGNFESLVTSGTLAVTSITDTLDTSTVKLTATDNVNEGGTVTYTAFVTSPVTGSAMIVTLANGETITIPVGQSSGTTTTGTTNDALLDNAPLTNSIASVSGGNYENLVADATPVSTNVTNTVDITHLSLAATSTVTEGGQITYTATLDNTASTAMNVTLSNGAIIHINAGQNSGSIDFAAPKEDVYLNGKVSVKITASTGGDFESLAINNTPAVTSVTDIVDRTEVSISGSDHITEGQAAIYTVSLTNQAHSDVTLKIAYSGTATDGSDFTGVYTVKIPSGASSASFNVVTLDNLLVENTENLVVKIVSATGGNFENLVVSSTHDSVSTSIIDNDTPLALDLDDHSSPLVFDTVSADDNHALQAFAVQLTGADASTVTTDNLQQYVTEHSTAFEVLAGHDGIDNLLGDIGDDIIFGAGGNDVLDGGKGNDTLLGGAGNDTLIGGQGNDTLIGGSGADTFVWKTGDTGTDVLKDFRAGEGDHIDLHDLLQGESDSTIDNFLKITTADGVSTLQVSSEGKLNDAGGAANADVSIKLEGNNWSTATVNSLIVGSDPTIKVDHNNS